MLSDPADWRREPGHGKYARSEIERRFLVRELVPGGQSSRLIEDYYLDGLRLRLRRVSADGHTVYKLTQKVRIRADDPTEALITNMYLSADEHARLCELPGRDLAKTRTVVPTPSHTFVVDEYRGRLQGLRLAEVEVGDASEPEALPAWLADEVTSDDRYSGGYLASADDQQIRELLHRYAGLAS